LVVKRGSRKPAIKKILLPTSFSSMDSAALEWALELARKFSAVLFVLHVIEAHKSYGRVKGGFVGRLRQSATRRLRAMLDSAPRQKREGVSLIETVTTFPRSWSGIVNFAQAQDIDMIVMSTHARKGVPRFLLGSVGRQCHPRSSLPDHCRKALTVHNAWPGVDGTTSLRRKLERILRLVGMKEHR
jgi:nucleotide-binding universal stress UspA family protein